MKQKAITRPKSRREAAYTLLEYCAGAAIIAGVIWVALEGLGQNLSTLLQAIGQWATERAASIQGGGGGG